MRNKVSGSVSSQTACGWQGEKTRQLLWGPRLSARGHGRQRCPVTAGREGGRGLPRVCTAVLPFPPGGRLPGPAAPLRPCVDSSQPVQARGQGKNTFLGGRRPALPSPEAPPACERGPSPPACSQPRWPPGARPGNAELSCADPEGPPVASASRVPRARPCSPLPKLPQAGESAPGATAGLLFQGGKGARDEPPTG